MDDDPYNFHGSKPNRTCFTYEQDWYPKVEHPNAKCLWKELCVLGVVISALVLPSVLFTILIVWLSYL